MPISVNHNPSARELRQFSGLYLPLFAALVGGYAYWNGQPTPALAVWSAGAALAVLGLARLTFARWLFLGLSYLTFPIGFVVSYAVLLAVFLLVVTPIALVLRARGRDALALKRGRGSAWIARPRRTGVEQHFRRY